MNEVEAILLAAVLAAVLAIWGVITQRIVARRMATLEYFSRLDNDKDQIAARKKFAEITKSGQDLIKYAEPAQFDSEESISLRLILNENERMAIGIQFGVLDRFFVARHTRGVLIRDWELSAPFIYKLRSNLSNPAIYHEFEDMVRVLSDRKMPRRSYFWRLWF